MSSNQVQDRATVPGTASADGRHPYFLDDPVLDGLVEVCLRLGGELWATRARMRRLERLLEVDGTPVTELLDAQADAVDEDREAWVAERDRFVERLFGVLAREEHVPAGEIV